MGRPRYADFVIWNHKPDDKKDSEGYREYYNMVLVNFGTINPICHRIEAKGRWADVEKVRFACNKQEIWSGWDSTRITRTKVAAQYAVPCLRCWPDARQSREHTVDVRAGRVDFRKPPH